MNARPLSLEDQLRRSVHQVQQAKRLTKESAKMVSESKAIVLEREQPGELTAWRAMREQADELLKSGFLPKAIRTPEQAIAIMQTGKELGLGPMQSLRGIHVIDGKPAMSADLIAGLALARVPGSTLRVVESTNTICRVEAARAGHGVTPFSFSFDDAKAAGLVGKDVWRRYPRAMLRARCLTEACRAVFPDVVMGLYSPEELEDSSPGQVIDVQPFREGREEQRTEITPHALPGEDQEAPPKPSDEFNEVMEQLKMSDRDVFDPACTWDIMCTVREIIGSKGAPSDLGKRISALYHGDTISPNQRKELGALWNRVDRKLTALEGKLKAPPVEASFTDEPDGTEAFSAREREPGDDDADDGGV